MKKSKKILIICGLIIVAMVIFSVSVSAVTEEEIRNRVAESSREDVSGNIFIWFLCAIAFMKISQKMSSFVSSLGISVGNTGGSMLGEALVVARGLSIGAKFLGGGGFGGKGGGGGGSAGGGGTKFLSGGLAGAVSRKFNNSAVSVATEQGGNIFARNAFNSSLEKGGSFANNIVSTVAKSSITNTGTITGETASKALSSYLGEVGQAEAPSYSDVEIGGGRMMGTETSSSHPEGIQFGMYNTEQYLAPEKGVYDTVTSVDGSQWYRQYAADTVEKTPYTAENNKIAYNETIVQKLAPMPRRKDKV